MHDRIERHPNFADLYQVAVGQMGYFTTLLGWGQGTCLRAPEAGKVLVRSLWLAQADLDPWEPAFEMTARILLPPSQALEAVLPYLTLAHQRITRRLFLEAMREVGSDVTLT